MSKFKTPESLLTKVASLSASDLVRVVVGSSSRNITFSNLVNAINSFTGAQKLNVITTTTNYVASSSNDVILCDVTTGSILVTLPDASLVEGCTIYVKKKDTSTNDITVQDAGANTIDGSATATLSGSGGAQPGIGLVSDGANWYILNA